MPQPNEWGKLPHAKPHLLVVDDQPINIRLIHELFSQEFEVFMATSGQQALEKCKSLMPDLVLLDIVMPGMDGYQVCAALKADAALSDIPVIFITGNSSEEDEVKGLELGAVDFIHKPINPVITRARVNTQLKLKQQSDLLRQVALIDGLTGLANRRRYEQELLTAWLQCARDNQPISVVICDIDNFKLYNDTYGHVAGDACLREVAQCMANSVQRPYDLVARYGGEEFIAVLPRTWNEGAQQVATNFFSVLQLSALKHEKNVTGLVTVSAGVATAVPLPNSSPEKLIAIADEALYVAKKSGRNRFHCIAMDSSHVSE